MNKIIALVLLLLIPLSISNAKDIEIENITLLESTGNTEEISPPTTEELKIYFDLKFKEIGEFSLCGYANLQFEKGMSFKEWFTSQYNTTGYEMASEDGSVLLPGGIIYSLDGVDANGQTLIVENGTYTCDTIAECISPASKILISKDGKTKIAKKIKENDEIAYYDFLENEIKIGKVKKVFIHQKATNFIKYTLEDNTYIEATDYHPIHTLNSWKSYTNRNGYVKPLLGDKVKTISGYQKNYKNRNL